MVYHSLPSNGWWKGGKGDMIGGRMKGSSMTGKSFRSSGGRLRWRVLVSLMYIMCIRGAHMGMKINLYLYCSSMDVRNAAES